jgi:cytidyltransferase-like protein
MKIGIISGYFNPLHFGHIEYINGAKNLCDTLVVIVNNDIQVKAKGSQPFMDEIHRANIVHSIKNVDFALVSRDTDKTVCETIKYVRTLWPDEPMAFYNSGDRTLENVDNSEKIVCNDLHIEFVIIPMEKKYSSSNLLKNI